MSTSSENGTMKKLSGANTKIATASPTMSKLATGLILGSLALAGLTTIGCDKVSPEQIAALTTGASVESGGQGAVADKADVRSRMTWQHNETFLVA
jgi:hypothetical protein